MFDCNFKHGYIYFVNEHSKCWTRNFSNVEVKSKEKLPRTESRTEQPVKITFFYVKPKFSVVYAQKVNLMVEWPLQMNSKGHPTA